MCAVIKFLISLSSLCQYVIVAILTIITACGLQKRFHGLSSHGTIDCTDGGNFNVKDPDEGEQLKHSSRAGGKGLIGILSSDLVAYFGRSVEDS